MSEMTNEEFRALCEETRQSVVEGRKKKEPFGGKKAPPFGKDGKPVKKEASNPRPRYTQRWAMEQGLPPKDPKARALFRMDTSAKRMGLLGMVKDLGKRVTKTTDPNKLQGIADAADDMIKVFTEVKKQALSRKK